MNRSHRSGQGTRTRTDSVRTYSASHFRHALPFLQTMYGAIQPGKIPRAVCLSRFTCRDKPPIATASCSAAFTPSHARGILPANLTALSRANYERQRRRRDACATRTNHPGKRLLIETVPRIEIFVNLSFKRRKHFLIETRTGCLAERKVGARRGFQAG